MGNLDYLTASPEHGVGTTAPVVYIVDEWRRPHRELWVLKSMAVAVREPFWGSFYGAAEGEGSSHRQCYCGPAGYSALGFPETDFGCIFLGRGS